MDERVTQKEYGVFQQSYDHFNATLFGSELPGGMITLQRQAGTAGYYHRAAFVDRAGASKNTDEIAINPDAMRGMSDVEVWQTLVHEMVHQWQDHFGSPSRRTYHNKEWAAKMEELGLMPSNTGKLGGKKTGQKMADYPIEGGRFLYEVEQIQQLGLVLNWESRALDHSYILTGANSGFEPDPNMPAQQQLPENLQETAVIVEPVQTNKKVRTKYTCPKCLMNVWGKPYLRVNCGECDRQLKVF